MDLTEGGGSPADLYKTYEAGADGILDALKAKGQIMRPFFCGPLNVKQESDLLGTAWSSSKLPYGLIGRIEGQVMALQVCKVGELGYLCFIPENAKGGE
jgi:hypothetical protein